MSTAICWFFLVCGAIAAAGSYYMHFARHQARIENAKHATGTWIGYGHFGAVVGVIGLIGVLVAVLA